MSNIPYFEQLTDGEALNPKKAAALAFQVKALADGGGVTYPIEINKGGTCQITQQTAINALTNSSTATTGQVLQRNSSGNAVWADALPYKSYVAVLNAPLAGNTVTVTVLENSLNLNITWTRGDYGCTGTISSPALVRQKTFLRTARQSFIFNNGGQQTQGYYFYFLNLAGNIEFYWDGQPGAIESFIEIRVYP
jgi:hypothetical protein